MLTKILKLSFTGLVIVMVSACSSSPSASSQSQKVLLGSFELSVSPGQNAIIRPQEKNIMGLSSGATQDVTVDRQLGWADSVQNNNLYVDVDNCTTSNWNGVTKVVSVNYEVTNKITSPTLVAPLELRVTGFYNNASGVITEVNTDLASQGCDNPMSLTNCDGNTDGFFDIVWPLESLTAPNYPEYDNDPGQDLSLLMGPDNVLSPGESTTCNFLQLTLSVETEVGMYFDVLGRVQGVGLPAPSVGAVTTPTKDLSPNLSITLSNGADTVRITGGDSEVTCQDGDPCDLDATANVVEVDYTLNANVANLLQVYQQDATQESSATSISVTHDNIVPVLTSIVPADGSISVSPLANIILTFDGNLEAASVTNSIFLLNRDGGVGDCSTFGPGEVSTVSQSGAPSAQVQLNPNNSMQNDQLYCVRVVGESGACDGADELRDEATNCLAAAGVLSSFTTTNNDTTDPTVDTTSPADGAANIPVNSPVVINFSEAMDPVTTENTSNITLNDGTSNVAGTLALSLDGLSVTFTPSSNLAFTTDYTLNVTTNVEDLSGNALALEYVSTFTTGSVLDTTSPTVVSIVPEDAATNVSETIRPRISFSEPMDPSTITTSNISMRVKSDATPVSIGVSLSGDGLTATVIPTSDLASSTTYLISVEFACTDIAGNNLASPITSEFTTSGVLDTTAPTIRQVVPADNGVDVSRWTAINVVFSEEMDPNSVHTGTIYLENLKTNPPSLVDGAVSIAADGLSATFTQLNTPLSKNQDYQVTVKGGTAPCTDCLKDLAGNVLAADVVTTFNTQHNDNSQPVVKNVAPSDTETSVPINANIVVTFSETIDPDTVQDSSFYITEPPSTTHIPGIVKLLPDGIHAKITPSSDFDPSTTYQIDVTNAVKNLANTKVTPFSSTFTTGTSQDTDGPVVTLAESLDGVNTKLYECAGVSCAATGVLLWPSIEITFDESIDASTALIDNNVEMIRDADSSRVPISLSVSPLSKIVTLNPVNLLNLNESYTVNMKNGLQNISGYPLQAFTAFDFTTVTTDPSPAGAPTVSTVVPVDGATGVLKDQVISITFNEAIDPDAVINGIFSVQQTGGNPPPPKADVTMALDATRTIVTITPLTDMKGKTNYEIRVTDKVVDDGNNALDCSIAGDGACDTGEPLEWISTFRTK